MGWAKAILILVVIAVIYLIIAYFFDLPPFKKDSSSDTPSS